MGIVDKTTLHRIDELCRQAETETDPAKIADNLREIIRELDRLLDAVDLSLRSAAETDVSATPKRRVS